jgi:hypothetical protein
MLTTLALTFLVGCIVGAVTCDLARWQRQQRSAAQNLLRAMDAGTIYYGQGRHAVARDQEPTDQG